MRTITSHLKFIILESTVLRSEITADTVYIHFNGSLNSSL